MGSGKSTVGPRVARRLGWSFLDLDDAIEDETGRSIASIFAEDGEERFRQMEAAALRRTAERERAVVALGGGALTNDDNLRFAKEHGVIVYLYASPGELARRLRDEAAHRPLLQKNGKPLSGEALRAKIAGMLTERAPFYEQAHAIVDTHESTPDETAGKVASIAKQGGLSTG